MKKKAAMVAITISMLLLSLVGLRFVEVAEANPITFPKQPPVITVYSPATGQTYNTSEIPLTATINVFNAIVRKIEMVSWLNYTLDGQPSASLTVIMPLDFGPGYTATINATLTGLSDGAHILEIYGQTTFNQSTYANTTFIVDTYSLESPTSTQSPAPNMTPSPFSSLSPLLSTSPLPTPFTASLAESASALNFGNKVNFTVTVKGGSTPYSYAWYIDNNLVETTNAPYYFTETASIGAHHVYVIVTDTNNNTAQTLAPEFNVLPNPNNTSSQSPSPSVPEFPTGIFASLIFVASTFLIAQKRRKNK